MTGHALLMELWSGGTEMPWFSGSWSANVGVGQLTVSDRLFLPDGTVSAPVLARSGDTGAGIWFLPNRINLRAQNTDNFSFANTAFVLGQTASLGWGSGDASASSLDVALVRDAANTLAQRNGTNAQEFRIENTFADASNREFVSLGFINTANRFSIEAEALGTGTVRGINLVSSAGTLGFFGVTPVARAAAYTVTNLTTDRAYDADTVLVAELADVVGTLISDLRTYGLVQ